MFDQSPLYWLLETEAYDYDLGVFKNSDLVGKVLIVSRQLWSVIREDLVYSILIGPGIFKGVAESGNRRIEVTEQISALIFDPTEMRYDEPLPLVDIISPEVIDPMAASKQEEIYTVIQKLIKAKGNVLAGGVLTEIKGDGKVPETVYYEQMMKRLRISHVSGKQRARFILGGTNGPMYRPLVKWYETRKYSNPERSKVMAVPFKKFASFLDAEVMDDWVIVEKAGLENKTGIDAIRDEYDQTYSVVQRNADDFIYEI